MTTVALLGLFGLCQRKKIVGRSFWRVFFIMWCVWTPYYYTVSQITSLVKIAPYEFSFFIGECAVLLATIIIMEITLHRYAFTQSRMWE